MENKKKLFTKYLFIAFFLIIIYLTYKIILPYFSAILLSLILVYLLYPLHKKLSRYIKNPSISSSIITFSIFIIIIIPLIIIANILVTEIFKFYHFLDLTKINNFISEYLQGNLNNYISPFLNKATNYLVQTTSNFLISLPQKLFGIIVGLFIIYYSLKDWDKLKKNIKMLLPLKNEEKLEVSKKFKETLDAILFGTILIAIIEGILAIFIYSLFGIGTPVIWALLTAIVSMLPIIGPASVWLPLSIYLIMKGQLWAGIGLGITSIIILTLIFDILIKNKIIGLKGKMHPIVVLLGIFGGVAVFGIMGFILGPFILSLFLFFIKIIYTKK